MDAYDYQSLDRDKSDNWVEKISNNALIVGGGGILNRGSFSRQLGLFEELAHRGKAVVLWGAGHNDKVLRGAGAVKSYNVDTGAFTLAGVRDYGRSDEWVPCVSCMHELFDSAFEIDKEVGLVLHKNTVGKSTVVKKFSGLPSIANTTDIDSFVEFIGSCACIITDSYHAMYWAMLLGCKVVVIPNSSKFFDFKYQPAFGSYDDCLSQIGKAQIYTGVLEECRERNRAFAKK